MKFRPFKRLTCSWYPVFFSGRIWACLNVYECVQANFLFSYLSLAIPENPMEMAPLNHLCCFYQAVLHVYLSKFLKSFPFLWWIFQGKTFFPFWREQRGNHFVRIIAKRKMSRLKQSSILRCAMLVYWLIPKTNFVYTVCELQFRAPDMFHIKSMIEVW